MRPAANAPNRRFPEWPRRPRSGRACRCALRRRPCAPGCAPRPSSTRTRLRPRARGAPRPRRPPSARAWARSARTTRAEISSSASRALRDRRVSDRAETLRSTWPRGGRRPPAIRPRPRSHPTMTPPKAPCRSSPSKSRIRKSLLRAVAAREQRPRSASSRRAGGAGALDPRQRARTPHRHRRSTASASAAAGACAAGSSDAIADADRPLRRLSR